MKRGYRWQRARIVKSDEKPELLGRELWIEIGSRGMRDVFALETMNPERSDCLITNLLADGYEHPMTVGADRMETLCRPNLEEPDKPSLDFAEAVELVRYQDWVKG